MINLEELYLATYEKLPADKDIEEMMNAISNKIADNIAIALYDVRHSLEEDVVNLVSKAEVRAFKTGYELGANALKSNDRC